MTDAARCAAEIVALHRAFEAGLGRGEGDPARFDAAFAPGFTMTAPTGRHLDRAAVLAFLHDARATRGEAFRIAIEDCRALHVTPPLILMHYVERQWTTSGETARRATALFDTSHDPPRWLSVQETWITPP